MIVSPFSSIQCRNGGIVLRRSFRTDAAPPGRSRRNDVLLTITPFFVDDKKTLPSTNAPIFTWPFVDLLTLLTIFRGVRASVNKGEGGETPADVENFSARVLFFCRKNQRSPPRFY
jgi:hypothetical protein